jgi:hypothetical protein
LTQLFLVATAVTAVLCPAPAFADIYGYVDAHGDMHLASKQLDRRYQLFVDDPSITPPMISSELKLLPGTGRLEDHIIYKRIQKTPNVKKFEAMVVREARRQNLDPALVKAVIAVESAYDPGAISPKGAIGLMQLIPDTAARYGVKLIADPHDNIAGGAHYLKDLIDMFDGNLPLALAGYNAGEGAVRQYHNEIPPYPETQQYVQLVQQFYSYFSGKTETVGRTASGRVHVTLPAAPVSTAALQAVAVPIMAPASHAMPAAGDAEVARAAEPASVLPDASLAP